VTGLEHALSKRRCYTAKTGISTQRFRQLALQTDIPQEVSTEYPMSGSEGIWMQDEYVLLSAVDIIHPTWNHLLSRCKDLAGAGTLGQISG